MPTITLPDAMTAAELSDECKRLANMIGGKCRIYASADNEKDSHVSIYADGVGGSVPGHFINGHNFPVMFAAAEAWIASRAVLHHSIVIRKMALAIIEITDEHTKCTRAALARRFSAAEIDGHSAAALDRASEMCGNAPFSIVSE